VTPFPSDVGRSSPTTSICIPSDSGERLGNPGRSLICGSKSMDWSLKIGDGEELGMLILGVVLEDGVSLVSIHMSVSTCGANCIVMN